MPQLVNFLTIWFMLMNLNEMKFLLEKQLRLKSDSLSSTMVEAENVSKFIAWTSTDKLANY